MSPRNRFPASRPWSKAALTLLAFLPWSAGARGEEYPIDVSNSVLTVRVFRSGLFSFLGHNHVIEGPISNGKAVLSDAPSIQLKVDARRLRVLDPHLSTKDRAEVQHTMEGPKVLDVGRFPEILFRSTTVDEKGSGRWRVHGELTLHGQTQPVVLEVKLEGGRYRGSTQIRQRDFGIRPVSFALGTIRVKDEVKIEFEIALMG